MSGFSSPPPKLPFALTDPESANTLRAYYGGGGVCAVEWRTGRMVQFTSSGTVFTQPVRDMNGHYMEAPLGMAGESWQDVAGSRSSGTVYQNTTGRPISVSLAGEIYQGSFNVDDLRGYFEVSDDGAAWVRVAENVGKQMSAFCLVPVGGFYRLRVYYYRTGGSLSISFKYWAELKQ